MRETLRQNETVKLEREYNDEKTTAYVVTVDGNDNRTYYVYNNKELAYMKALSTYLARLNVIDKSYDECKTELNGQEIPYQRLKEITKMIFDNFLDDEDKESVRDRLTDDETDFLDFVEKPYEVRTYTVKKIISKEITIAIHEDADEYKIESELEAYADDINDNEWDFECYDFNDYSTDETELSENAVDDWDVDIKLEPNN